MSTAPLTFEAWELNETKPTAGPSASKPCRFSARRPIEDVARSASGPGLYRIYNRKDQLLSRGETLDLRKRLLSHMRAAERLCGKGAGEPTGLLVQVCPTPGATKEQLRAWERAERKGSGDRRELEQANEAAEYLYELAQELASLRSE